jgi:hypothetical protein
MNASRGDERVAWGAPPEDRDPAKGALVGAGVGAAGGAIYDIAQ